ncbi:hypothetical protein ACIOUE_03630 [Streptomyces xanthochromogenes]|uniref:hypothetical protein n=1 Tax=Streptomyces TaxID=1883 RepID=UPI00136E956A|nr:hypothetical protein [Streptomyces sp. SID1034]MYV91972.1 hypothetical protein [Streptomyces sp. SID1034]
MRPRAALAATDLGFAAFAERNRPRYTRYAQARLAQDTSVTRAVRATFVYAREDWHWLLGQPSLAADVWEELRYQVRVLSGAVAARDTEVRSLYDGLPENSADSVLLCHRLGLAVGEAAELMGLEISAVQAGLAVAHRALPHLALRGRI